MKTSTKVILILVGLSLLAGAFFLGRSTAKKTTTADPTPKKITPRTIKPVTEMTPTYNAELIKETTTN